MGVHDQRDAPPSRDDQANQPGGEEHVSLDAADRPEAERIEEELWIDERRRHPGLDDTEAGHAHRALPDERADARPLSRRPDPGEEGDGPIGAHRRRRTRSSWRAWVGRTMPVPMRIGG